MPAFAALHWFAARNQPAAGNKLLKPSVLHAIHDLLSVVHAAKENGEDPYVKRHVIDLEVENRILGCHRAKPGPNFCVFRSPVRIRDKCPHIGKRFVDPRRSADNSTFEVLAEFLDTTTE